MAIKKRFRIEISRAACVLSGTMSERDAPETNILRVSDELPSRTGPLGGTPAAFRAFSEDFLSRGRGDNREGGRDAL